MRVFFREQFDSVLAWSTTILSFEKFKKKTIFKTFLFFYSFEGKPAQPDQPGVCEARPDRGRLVQNDRQRSEERFFSRKTGLFWTETGSDRRQLEERFAEMSDRRRKTVFTKFFVPSGANVTKLFKAVIYEFS